MDTMRYITDKGRADVDASIPWSQAQWHVATQLGLGQSRYDWPRPGWAIEDRCPTDRETLGLTMRAFTAA